MTQSSPFQQAVDFLVAHRTDYDRAVRDFAWPRLERFNWAIDHFDVLAEANDTAALVFAGPAGVGAPHSFAALRRRSNQVANLLRDHGVARGDRILVMLPNVAALWEAMLAAFKLGAVVIPATPQLTRADLEDRFQRGRAKHVITDPEGAGKVGELGQGGVRILVGPHTPGWLDWSLVADQSAALTDLGETQATDPLLLYFTSGTTAKPKLVLHSHQSYPIGHLTTAFWIGLKPGDRHVNISSPGWAKHAYSSFFAPWIMGATVIVFDHPRAEPKAVLETLVRAGATSFCAPPTLWRMLINEDLAAYPVVLRELLSAGEPLNPEVIERVAAAWGLTIREGYGQTETTLLVGSFPGQPVKPGSMGRPAPGFRISLRPVDGQEGPDGGDGEISVSLEDAPIGLMDDYLDDPSKMTRARQEGFYRTGDVAVKDEDGYLTYVGRSDDVFKSAGYRLSPFELESVLIEHPAVAEAAVVESPDPVRLVVPKAFVAVRPGFAESAEVALDILRFVRAKVAPYKRIRRIEFAELPKTISGKIRRVELRHRERQTAAAPRGPRCFWEEDLGPA